MRIKMWKIKITKNESASLLNVKEEPVQIVEVKNMVIITNFKWNHEEIRTIIDHVNIEGRHFAEIIAENITNQKERKNGIIVMIQED